MEELEDEASESRGAMAVSSSGISREVCRESLRGGLSGAAAELVEVPSVSGKAFDLDLAHHEDKPDLLLVVASDSGEVVVVALVMFSGVASSGVCRMSSLGGAVFGGAVVDSVAAAEPAAVEAFDLVHHEDKECLLLPLGSTSG